MDNGGIKMIDTDKYEGHSKGPWEWGDDEEWSKNALVVYDDDGFKESLGVTKPHDPKKPDAQLIADAPLLLQEVKRLREALITVQHSLIWDEKDREMDGDPITLEALVTQVEQVRSDITEMIE
jgi:hypothetical protein